MPTASMSHAPYGMCSSISPGQYVSSASNVRYGMYQSLENIPEPVGAARAFQPSPESRVVNQQTGEPSPPLQPGFTKPDQATCKPETTVTSDATESQMCQKLGVSPNLVRILNGDANCRQNLASRLVKEVGDDTALLPRRLWSADKEHVLREEYALEAGVRVPSRKYASSL